MHCAIRGFLLALIAQTQLDAADGPWRPSEKLLDAVRMIESGNGALVVGDRGKSLGDYQVSEAAWTDVSRWRKARGKRTYSYARNVFNPKLSRIYAADYLALLRQQLKNELRRTPTAAEIYAAYNMGMNSFAKCGFDLDRVNRQTASRCRLVAQLSLGRSRTGSSLRAGTARQAAAN